MTTEKAEKPRRRGWFLIVACLAAGVAGVALGRLTGSSAAPDGSAGAIAPSDGQVYTCSMHPQVRSPNPRDKCPLCGMDLIPVPADEDEASAEGAELPRLRLTARAAALMQVEVQPVQRRAVHVPVRLYGRLDYDETRLRDVNVKVAGWIEKLHVAYAGATVARGQPLLELYSPELVAAQEEYLLAWRNRRGDDDPLLAAARTKLRNFDVGDEQIGQLQRRGESARAMTVVSPHEGVVIAREAYEGLRVEPGMRTYRIADLSRLWVQLEVYESDQQWLAPGQKASFMAQSFPGEAFEGTVAFIDPVVNDRTRTVRVRVDIANADGRLKPGMFVRGEVHASIGHDEAPLVIPASAPLITGERAVVYVQLPEADRPTFEPRDVVLGPRAGAWHVVREGVREGELVVMHGAFKIDSELQIRGRPSMMQSGGDPPPAHSHEGGH